MLFRSRLGTSNNIGVSRDFSIGSFTCPYGFLLDFEDWTTPSDYTTKHNITKDGFTIDAVGMVIGSDDPNSSPISGSKSFVLNGGQRFNTYITISGLHGISTVSMKWAPWNYGSGDRDTTLLVSDGTTTRRFQIPPYIDALQTLAVEFNNPSAQQIRISLATSTQRNARIRIDDIRF